LAILLLSFEPHLDFAGLVSRFDVHDARTAADRAVFRVLLALAATQVDGKLVRLAAEWALDRCRGSLKASRHVAEA
jgi:hypothetical protein